MTNSHALSERRTRAAAVAAAYAENDKVAAVLLAGSVARGLADDLSDIEVDIFWHFPVDRRRSPYSASSETTGRWSPPTSMSTSGPTASSSTESRSTPASSWSRHSTTGSTALSGPAIPSLSTRYGSVPSEMVSRCTMPHLSSRGGHRPIAIPMG